ncbi:putative Heat shock protein DnaJ, cysteine-rich [Lupinus albus]|uniref:Putative Heat shock protein DnaJ, cysteine-rich n=1 Tax=Lupinus albus TaxID=3870 RepID=A0A6A4PJV0_LUPAL|nr:putative Heat shock protein DnaJ, cysteine-rich [Lupinus albus]
MTNSLCLSSLSSLISSNKPGTVAVNSVARKVFPIKESCLNPKVRNLKSLEVKAVDDKSETTKVKTRSIVCSDCEGNGAILCTQCKGTGINSEDHFNGRFKAGGLCWLCRGKRDILCGSCNGAGFLGGFMSTFEE